MILRQKENFFPRLDLILPELKKIKLYTQEEFNEKHNEKQTWPGHRSTYLENENIFLSEYIKYLLISYKLIDAGHYNMQLYLHLRLNDDADKDWVHKDTEQFAALVYLSETNLNSGTVLLDDNRNVINDIKFIQNRCIFYSGKYNHVGYGHNGKDVNDGRFTLNIFADRR
tara:strand:- start:1417 stop:1926 length:510 start_codon:yes stop_codon:yes gene_type:complete